MKTKAYYQQNGAHALVSGDTPPWEVLESEGGGDFLVDARLRDPECCASHADRCGAGAGDHDKL